MTDHCENSYVYYCRKHGILSQSVIDEWDADEPVVIVAVKIMDQGKYGYSWANSSASAMEYAKALFDEQFGVCGPRVADEPKPKTPKPPPVENSETPEQKRQRYRTLAKQRKRRAAIDVQVVAVGLLMAIGVVLVNWLAVH